MVTYGQGDTNSSTSSSMPPGLKPAPGRTPVVYGAGGGSPGAAKDTTAGSTAYDNPEAAIKATGTRIAVYKPDTGKWHSWGNVLLTPGGIAYSSGGGAAGQSGYFTSSTDPTTGKLQVTKLSKQTAQDLISRSAAQKYGIKGVQTTITSPTETKTETKYDDGSYSATYTRSVSGYRGGGAGTAFERSRLAQTKLSTGETGKERIENWKDWNAAWTQPVSNFIAPVTQKLSDFGTKLKTPRSTSGAVADKTLGQKLLPTPDVERVSVDIPKSIVRSLIDFPGGVVSTVGSIFRTPETIRSGKTLESISTGSIGVVREFKARPTTLITSLATTAALSYGATKVLGGGIKKAYAKVKTPQPTGIGLDIKGSAIDIGEFAKTSETAVSSSFEVGTQSNILGTGTYEATLVGIKPGFKTFVSSKTPVWIKNAFKPHFDAWQPETVPLYKGSGVWAGSSKLTPGITFKGKPVSSVKTLTVGEAGAIGKDVSQAIESLGSGIYYPFDDLSGAYQGITLARSSTLTPETTRLSIPGASRGEAFSKRLSTIPEKSTISQTNLDLRTWVESAKPYTTISKINDQFVSYPVTKTRSYSTGIARSGLNDLKFTSDAEIDIFGWGRSTKPPGSSSGVGTKIKTTATSIPTLKSLSKALITDITESTIKSVKTINPVKTPPLFGGVQRQGNTISTISPPEIKSSSRSRTVIKQTPVKPKSAVSQFISPGLSIGLAKKMGVDISGKTTPMSRSIIGQQNAGRSSQGKSQRVSTLLELSQASSTVPKLGTISETIQTTKQTTKSQYDFDFNPFTPYQYVPPTIPVIVGGGGGGGGGSSFWYGSKRGKRGGTLEPILSPLADPLSIAKTEATTFSRARHQKPTKQVKKEFVGELERYGLAFRFPTFEMKKRKKEWGLI